MFYNFVRDRPLLNYRCCLALSFRSRGTCCIRSCVVANFVTLLSGYTRDASNAVRSRIYASTNDYGMHGDARTVGVKNLRTAPSEKTSNLRLYFTTVSIKYHVVRVIPVQGGNTNTRLSAQAAKMLRFLANPAVRKLSTQTVRTYK